jgi:hypothetical protein
MAIITLKAGLDTLLACLNHFPLFALMLRFKDSRRLPGGIRFTLNDTPSSVVFPSSASDEQRVSFSSGWSGKTPNFAFATAFAAGSLIYLKVRPSPLLLQIPSLSHLSNFH